MDRRARDGSLETILTFENRDASQWSVVWSTANIPGMDNAIGAGGRRLAGRRRVRAGSLALSALFTLHCRVAASALTGGILTYTLCLLAAVILLANPLRHFEVYLGQWSISGPGRAFRILPMFDGIGLAMSINAIVRAIYCCGVAAITLVILLKAIEDAKLPFTYCRDWNLKTYDASRYLMFSKYERLPLETKLMEEPLSTSTVGLAYTAWRNMSYLREGALTLADAEMCHETYSGSYPISFKTPSYNYFYVEVAHLRDGMTLKIFDNVALLVCIFFVWFVIWILMISERIKYGRLIWNNIPPWFGILPWIWVAVLIATSASNLNYKNMKRTDSKIMSFGTKEIGAIISDALEVALYIHSASMGTELIHGKGLNHYASGHIDNELNGENVWHSLTVTLLAIAHAFGAHMCSLVDYTHAPGYTDKPGIYKAQESTLWVIPMYMKCLSTSNYSHFMATLLFGGLTFSYIATAFILLKTALHTIFEYRVKLVFVEQLVVATLMFTCLGFSALFTTNGGLALLESTDAVMTGVAMPAVCLLELISLLYVYRGHDFVSDLNVATEDNVCSTRISTQWQIIPAIMVVTVMLKINYLTTAEMPTFIVYLALAPLAAVVAAVPLRAAHNAYTFLRPAPRHGT